MSTLVRTEPLPRHFKQKIPKGKTFFGVQNALSCGKLNTVCEEAKCPNRTHCFSRGTLAFQILGKICTRSCAFCAQTRGVPNPVDIQEPERILECVKTLKIKHAVITSPSRDDLSDGGAGIFARTVSLIHSGTDVTVEVLTSDFQGDEPALKIVLDSRPDIFNHNIETVRRLTPSVRSKAEYEKSLRVLQFAAQYAPHCRIKSGLMTGLGETLDEIFETLNDLHCAGVRDLTVGQYLQPSAKNWPVKKFYTLEEFKTIEIFANRAGFENVMSGPLVRSSYHADEMVK